MAPSFSVGKGKRGREGIADPAWSGVGTGMKLTLHGSSLTLKGSAVRWAGIHHQQTDQGQMKGTVVSGARIPTVRAESH